MMGRGDSGALEALSGDTMSPLMPKSLRTFYRSEPLALGITQIFIGLAGIAIGIFIDLPSDVQLFRVHFEAPIWTGILYVISGSLSVAAAKNPKMPLMTVLLGMNATMVIYQSSGPTSPSACQPLKKENEIP
ncbi:membrane-spanning 4-domains subfamily A member 15-like isoform X2 [Rhineura floridana]|uniref:membrane-spanning 4-domains subfamily A member 15-like isoform X2 n=1 Tax=Rhineura floridana TaxID=261503 RepID=UPI002AC8230B|nr:membrane-spanning 4-domains subfamily A member 15-like isoform X2 [Rhineura floridana]